MLEKNFKKIIGNIKEEIINTQIKTMREVNNNLIMLYFKLGKIVSENKKYGSNFTKQVSIELKLAFPNMKGFSERNIRSMRLFYEEYADDKIWQQLVAKLPWGHNLLLIEKIKDKNIRKMYAENTIKNGWSRNVLALQIKSKFHKRIGNSNNNFPLLLPPADSELVNNVVKDPYVFEFINLNNNYKEKELENKMISKIRDVLLELGKGFSFVGNQYKISVDNQDFYIDLLFYHLELRCYIVVELKAEEFKPEYVGQIGFYVTAIDKLLKKENDNPTIGLLLCREKNRVTVDWSLQSTNVPIGVSTYKLKKQLHKNILEKLPTEAEINFHINLEKEKAKTIKN